MIIGVSGFARSGKDTVGAYLERVYGFRRARFAAVLKEVCARVFGFSGDQIDGALKETPDARYPMPGVCPTCGTLCSSSDDGGWRCEACERIYRSHLTPRLAMQTLGTEWGRRLCADVWVEATLRDCVPGERWVLCDVRFPNEAIGIARRGGRVIRLLRGAPESAHPSETALVDRHDLFDAIIHNSGTVAELHDHIDARMEEWGIGPKEA